VGALGGLLGIRGCKFLCRPAGRVFLSFRQSLDENEQRGNQEDSEHRCRQHSRDNRRAHDPPRGRAGAFGDPKRNAAEDERKRSHQNRPQAQPRSLEGRVDDSSPLLHLVYRELNDQDGVFCGQPHQHHQADLRVDVVVKPPREQPQISAEYGDRRAEQDRERQ